MCGPGQVYGSALVKLNNKTWSLVSNSSKTFDLSSLEALFSHSVDCLSLKFILDLKKIVGSEKMSGLRTMLGPKKMPSPKKMLGPKFFFLLFGAT